MDSIPDILKDANDNPMSLMKYATNQYLRNLLSAAYIPEQKFVLPEGDPPYKSSGDISSAVTKGAFWQICRKLAVFQRRDIKSIVKETQFIQALEQVSDQEAKILLCTKDQCLTNLYPNLTLEKLVEIGYFK